MAFVNSWFHLPEILFSSLQLKLFDIAQRRAQKDAKHKKMLNLLCIVYMAIFALIYDWVQFTKIVIFYHELLTVGSEPV